MITQEELQERFEYIYGGLYYRDDICIRGAEKGTRFGCLNRCGYRHGQINYKTWLEHRLIFLYCNGYLPKEIDHINGIRDDNRIENLRESTRSQNFMNRIKIKGTTSKYKGASYDKRAGKNPWRARIKKDSVTYCLGTFATEIEAAIAYNEAAIKLFREFAVLNEIESH